MKLKQSLPLEAIKGGIWNIFEASDKQEKELPFFQKIQYFQTTKICEGDLVVVDFS